MLSPIETAKPAPIDAISAQRSAYSITSCPTSVLKNPLTNTAALHEQLLVQRATLVFLSLGLPLRSVGVYSKPNSSYSDPNELEQCPYLFLRPEAGRYTEARTENFDI
jgi:hypothetical protein